MHVIVPETLVEHYINNDGTRNKYTGLLNANFQDYVDALAQGGQYETKVGKLKSRISSLGSAIGMAAGSLGGPGGLAMGYSIGNVIGKYLGNIMGQKIYGQAIADMSEIAHVGRVRHAQMATSLAFTNQIDGAIDTLRQNENKRKKDEIQAMQV